MAENTKAERPKLSWTKKLIFAGVTTISFFALLELGLAALSFRSPQHSGDPFVGFSAQAPLFVETTDDKGGEWLETAPGKRVWFNAQRFPRRKPENGRRIFCVGGSTTFGRPFDDATSYSGWLRKMLPATDANTDWEVINAGGVSYASYRVAALMEELAQYQPDLFVVYTAHNEFLERRTYASMFERSKSTIELTALVQRSRVWGLACQAVGQRANAEIEAEEILPEEVDEILNHSSGPSSYNRDSEWAAGVLRHYEWNLNRMVEIAREAGAEIVFVTPASNLRDCSPFKSQYDASADAKTCSRLDKQLADVGQSLRGDLNPIQRQLSLELAEAAVFAAPHHAMAQYLLGRAQYAVGDFESANEAFQRAVDEDVCPLRATSSISDILRDVAKRREVPLVDFDLALRERSIEQQGNSCLGKDFFLDHVHPTIDVHRLLAIWIIQDLLKEGLLSGRLPSEEELLAIKNEVESGIDMAGQAIAFRNLAKVLHWAGKFSEAAPRARDAIRLRPDDLESRMILADCFWQSGNLEAARREYESLFAVGEFERAYLPFGELLWTDGDLANAKSYLIRAAMSEREAQRARAHYALGCVHLELGEYQFALVSLKELDQIFPDDAETFDLMGQAENGLGNWEAACDHLRRSILLAPANSGTRVRLARILSRHEQLDEAESQVDTVLQQQPADKEAQELKVTIRLQRAQ